MPQEIKRPQTPRPNNGPQGFKPGDSRRNIALVAVLALVLGITILPRLFNSTPVLKVTYSKFLGLAHEGTITKAVFYNASGNIDATTTKGVKITAQGPYPLIPADIKALRYDGVIVTFSNPSSFSSQWMPTITTLLILGLISFFFMRMAGRQMGGMMSIAKSRAKLFDEDRPSTTFSDVAGYEGVKQEISEVVSFLKNPEKYHAIGASIPKGVLLVGPPGTGKTLIARAVAGEARVPFLSISGSDFMEMFVGVGASRVRDLFATARKHSPSIIFIDEIDSIGRKRGAGLGGGHDEREQTLNQMLSEMDGFDSAQGVVMIAATNRPDVLDPALLRPGRFDRQVVVPLPDLDERLPILKVHTRNKKLATDVDLELVARGTPGMSGADLANLVNEAALHAVRRGATSISMIDFESARDRIIMGAKRDTVVMREPERERVAYHEGGHALLAYVLEKADPLHKISITPHGMALGVTMTLPEEDRHVYSRQHIEDSICMRMGGRVAELLVYGDLSTGAADDLQRNTELARRMVREWGMSKKVGPMAWGSNSQVFLGEDLMNTREYSDEMAKTIDDEVERILREQEARAIEVLTLHRRGLESVARALLEHESIDGEAAARLIDEAHGQPVHPEGVKTGKAISIPAPANDVVAEPTTEWAPPSLPGV